MMGQKECKKYIECDAAKEAVYKIIVPEWVHVAFKKCIDDVPAADVRPVIYCKECKHRPVKEYGRIRAPKDADVYTDYKCPFVCEDSWYNRMPADDDYCSCGEKREEP